MNLKIFKRGLLLPFVILFIYIISLEYSGLDQEDIIFSYKSIKGFKKIDLLGKKSLYITENYPEYTLLDISSRKTEKIVLDNKKCVKNFSLPELAVSFSDSDFKQQRVVFEYLDTYDEYYGFFYNPAWEAEYFYFDKSMKRFYTASISPLIHKLAEEKKQFILSNLEFDKTRPRQEYGERYIVNAKKEDIKFDKADYIYFSILDEKCNALESMKILYDTVKNIENIEIFKVDNNVYVFVCEPEKVSIYKSSEDLLRFKKIWNNSFEFNDFKIRNENNNFYILNYENNKCSVFSLELNSNKLNVINKFEYKNNITQIDLDIEKKNVLTVTSDNNREYIDIINVYKGNSIYSEGYIFPLSIKDVIFLDSENIIIHEQVSEEDYNIYLKHF